MYCTLTLLVLVLVLVICIGNLAESFNILYDASITTVTYMYLLPLFLLSLIACLSS